MTNINTQTLPTVLTVPELADYLRVGLNSAYTLVKSGRIPSIKVGRQIRIRRDDAEAFMHGAF